MPSERKPKIKILNLYAGIGGNRKLWQGHEVTAVEYDEKLAKIYSDLFPEDTVIIGDAHEYLLKHHNEFDFIWSSPPCQTHSSFRHNIMVRFRGTEPAYPDMTLYEEIVFMTYNSSALWLVENVMPYYPPMMNPVKRNRHLYWANFDLPEVPPTEEKIRSMNKISDLEQLHGFDLSAYKLPNKRQVLRNCVDPEAGRLFLEAAERIYNERNGR